MSKKLKGGMLARFALLNAIASFFGNAKAEQRFGRMQKDRRNHVHARGKRSGKGKEGARHAGFKLVKKMHRNRRKSSALFKPFRMRKARRRAERSYHSAWKRYDTERKAEIRIRGRIW